MISNVRENEDIMKKLERVLGICSNTRDNIENLIVKYSGNISDYNEAGLKEDLIVISANMDSILKLVDPIFRHYLVLPNTIENDNAPLLLNTRKSDSLIKYESSLMEKCDTVEKNQEVPYFNNMAVESSNSPHTNFAQSTISGETSNRIKENTNTISKLLGEKLKKRGKDVTVRYHAKKEEKRYPQDLSNHFNILKSALNK